jgi:hypothetical protein
MAFRTSTTARETPSRFELNGMPSKSLREAASYENWLSDKMKITMITEYFVLKVSFMWELLGMMSNLYSMVNLDDVMNLCASCPA